jgi:predicted MFS family arabinose efflux permease
MSAGNPLDIPGWRWMLLMEGGATVVCGSIAYFLFVDGPAQARWLRDEEREWLTTTMAAEQRATPPPQSSPLSSALRDSRCWLAAGIWCATLIGANGMMFWLPLLLKDLANLGELTIGVISAVPWLGVGLGMWFNSKHSDATGERHWHVGVPLGICALALLCAVSVPPGLFAIALLFIAGLGLGGAQGVFWSIPTTFLHRTAAAAGITLINLVGNIGSLVGPVAIGWIRDHSEIFAAPIWMVAGVMAFGTVLLVSLHARRT